MKGIFRPPSWLNRTIGGPAFTIPPGVQVHITCIGGGGGGSGGVYTGSGGGGSGSSGYVDIHFDPTITYSPGQIVQLTPTPLKPAPLLAVGEWTKRTSRWPWSKEETTEHRIDSIKDLRELIQ